MRVSTYRSGRPDYYDRAPVIRTQVADLFNVAPGGPTVRWTYTVPVGKRAWINAIFVRIMRVVAAGALGYTTIQVIYTPSGGSAATLIYTFSQDNTVNFTVERSNTGYGLMLAGDNLQCVTYDSSTGGQFNMLLTAKIEEFDA